MPAPAIGPDPILASDGCEWAGQLLRLMAALETSLGSSRRAMLALDLAAIERGSGEQAVLIREFAAIQRRRMAPPAARNLAAEGGVRRLAAGALELEEEMERSRGRILEAIRLQSALLARARSKLRVLANMLTRPGDLYGPL